jgi:hypothetical protein
MVEFVVAQRILKIALEKYVIYQNHEEDSMRFIELTLLSGLLMSGYSGQAQDVVKNEKSVAPVNPVQTSASAKTAVATADAGQKPDVLLPDNIKLIIGQGETRNYYVRVREIHNLKKNLPPEQVEALYRFLYEKLDKQELPDLQFNGLKNEIVIELMKQTTKPEALSGHLVAMYYDKSFDPTWRDYCVQFFGKWYEQAPVNESREAMVKGLYDALQERNSSLGGTAITMLCHLTHLKEFDKDKISDLAYELMTAPDCAKSGKINAMQVCAELRNKKALPIARDWAANSNEMFVKMSAIAAVGMLGDPSDLPLLNHYKNSSDIRLSGPAKAAMAKINKAYKLSKY